jgi:hypothetical protein
MSDVEILRCPDPGAPNRLTGDARDELAGALRGWQRNAPPALLVDVVGDAWAHVAGEDAGLRDRPAINRVHALVTALYGLACPVVVAVDGAVSGLGCALLLAADVRVGSQRSRTPARAPPAWRPIRSAGRPSSGRTAAGPAPSSRPPSATSRGCSILRSTADADGLPDRRGSNRLTALCRASKRSAGKST